MPKFGGLFLLAEEESGNLKVVFRGHLQHCHVLFLKFGCGYMYLSYRKIYSFINN